MSTGVGVGVGLGVRVGVGASRGLGQRPTSVIKHCSNIVSGRPGQRPTHFTLMGTWLNMV